MAAQFFAAIRCRKAMLQQQEEQRSTFRLDVQLRQLRTKPSIAPVELQTIRMPQRLPDPDFPHPPEFWGRSTKMTDRDRREAAMEGEATLSPDAGLALPVYSLTRDRRRLFSLDRLFVHGVQVQS
jgi:hypothetical protein